MKFCWFYSEETCERVGFIEYPKKGLYRVRLFDCWSF